MMREISRREALAAGAGLVAVAGGRAQAEIAYEGQNAPFDPTSRYAVKRVASWTVMVNRGLEEQRLLWADVLRLLELQLYQITRVVPKPALEKLRKVWLWAEVEEAHTPCMAYHPDAGWLRDHGMNPQKAKCVEIANARNFLAWTLQQPWMVLHELAHAYHDQALPKGFENPEIRAAYDAAVKGGKYESVLHWNGKPERHYALNNPQEYFAEASEAYFGTNDFYPFVRAELQQHDPEGYRAVQAAWNA